MLLSEVSIMQSRIATTGMPALTMNFDKDVQIIQQMLVKTVEDPNRYHRENFVINSSENEWDYFTIEKDEHRNRIILVAYKKPAVRDLCDANAILAQSALDADIDEVAQQFINALYDENNLKLPVYTDDEGDEYSALSPLA